MAGLVSIADVIEVRGAGFTSPELLALAAQTANSLLLDGPHGKDNNNQKILFFDSSRLSINPDGTVSIEAVERDAVEEDAIPPEIADDNNAALQNGGVAKSATPNQMAVFMYCLGKVMASAGALECGDAALYSLVNLATVAHVDTRPQPQRLFHMANNRLEEPAQAILQSVYEEIMGDGEDDLTDEEDEEMEDDDEVIDDEDEAMMAQVQSHGQDTPSSSGFSEQRVTSSPVAPPRRNHQQQQEEEQQEQRQQQQQQSHQAGSTNPFDETPRYVSTLSGRDPFESESASSASSSSSPPSSHHASNLAPAATRPTPIREESARSRNALDDDKENGGFGPESSSLMDDSIVEAAHEQQQQQQPHKTSATVVVPVGGGRKQPPDTFDGHSRLVEPRERGEENVHKSSTSSSSAHVDAVVIASTMAARRRRSTAEEEPAEEEEEEEDETPIELAFQEARHQSRLVDDIPPSPMSKTAPPPPRTQPIPAQPKQTPSAASSLGRRNSLGPGRVSGRASRRGQGPRPTVAVPEFSRPHESPALRLRAQTSRKKRLSLLRVSNDSEVWVQLLDGRRVQVSCRSDAVAIDIMSVLCSHCEFHEHVFYGLAVTRDGEHFFLEDEQRLEKYAPSGWKWADSKSSAGRTLYVLHLRFRFYPRQIDFIKTRSTTHALYLQLRQDVLAGRLGGAQRETSIRLGALALQAEFGPRPPAVITNYFSADNYLPARFCASEEEQKRAAAQLMTAHGLLGHIGEWRAENDFIEMCQQFWDYGGHEYRVMRSVDRVHDDRTHLLIMPHGVVLAETTAGVMRQVADWRWSATKTLQFDGCRLSIVAVDDRNSTLYTDHHSKARYLVRFAATQHRFELRMRAWTATLRSQSRVANAPDVAIDTDMSGRSEREEKTPLREEERRHDEATRKAATLPPVMTRVVKQEPKETAIDDDREEEAAEEADYEEEEERVGTRLSLVLTKEPGAGLGLTLVDGTLQGRSAVYVKSVTPGGAGGRAGVEPGDRLVAVDGHRLGAQHDRHAAVKLVGRAGATLRLSLLRLHSVQAARLAANANTAILERRTTRQASNVTVDNDMPMLGKSMTDLSEAAVFPNNGGGNNTLHAPPSSSRLGGGARTPPPPKRAVPPQKRQRAVSDFGAFGDKLPQLDSDDVVALGHRDDEESEEEEVRGEYRLPPTALYTVDAQDVATAAATTVTASSPATQLSPTGGARSNATTAGGQYNRRTSSNASAPVSLSTPLKKYTYARKSNLDWADDLGELSEEEAVDERGRRGRGPESIQVELERADNGSLGIQIASSAGKVLIKRVTAGPALSSSHIREGDTLLEVNGTRLEALPHDQVVQLLQQAGPVVTLTLVRRNGADPSAKRDGAGHRSELEDAAAAAAAAATGDDQSVVPAGQHVVDIIIRRPTEDSSLGVALARRTGALGVWIRTMAADSPAALDGRLHVGDRVWAIDGVLVGNRAPVALVQQLRHAGLAVRFSVLRPLN